MQKENYLVYTELMEKGEQVHHRRPYNCALQSRNAKRFFENPIASPPQVLTNSPASFWDAKASLLILVMVPLAADPTTKQAFSAATMVCGSW